MKFLYNKSIKNKLIIACVIVALFTFITPNYTRAAGGILKDGIEAICIFVCDVLIKITQRAFTGEWEDVVVKDAGEVTSGDEEFDEGKILFIFSDDHIDWPVIKISPELIFANRIPVLNVNFIQDTSATIERGKDVEEGHELFSENTEKSLEQLRKVIATWYKTMRIIAIVGLLSVLVYIGIRIMISSVGEQRAKYKDRLKDWLIAFILIFMLHYIMSFTLAITETVSEKLYKSLEDTSLEFIDGGTIDVHPPERSVTEVESDPLADVENNNWYSQAVRNYNNWPEKDENKMISLCTNEGCYDFEENESWTECPKCKSKNVLVMKYKWYSFVIDVMSSKNANVTDYGEVAKACQALNINEGRFEWTAKNGEELICRWKIDSDGKMTTISGSREITRADGSTKEKEVYYSTSDVEQFTKVTNYLNYARLYTQLKDEYVSFGYTVMYVALTAFTIMFVFRYTKRVIYIAFLTLMAPLVALSYPLDKLKDGKAQAFDLWLKEYIFNIIIQPFHLLIFTVLMSAAGEMIKTNIIFAIVAMGFLVPAEKLIRRFFNLDQATTMSAAGSFAGGAIFSSIVGRLARPPKPPTVGGGEKEDDGGIFNDQRIPDRIGGFGQGSTPSVNMGDGSNDMDGAGTVAGAVGAAAGTVGRGILDVAGNTAKTFTSGMEDTNTPNPNVGDGSEGGYTMSPGGVLIPSSATRTNSPTENTSNNTNTPPRLITKEDIYRGDKKIKNDTSNLPVWSGRRAVRGVAGRVGNYLTNDKMKRKIIRGAGRIGGAALFTAGSATIAATAGVLSGDAGTTAKLMAAAGAGGFAVGGQWAERTVDNVNNAGKIIDQEGFGVDYKEFQRRQAITNKINSYENKKQLEQTLKADTVERLYANEGALLRKYYNAGITDVDDIRRAEEQMAPVETETIVDAKTGENIIQVKKDEQGNVVRKQKEMADDDTRISYALAAKKYGAGLASSNPKTRQDNEQAIKNRMRNAAESNAIKNLGRELSDSELKQVEKYADEEANSTIKFIDSFNK